MTLTIEVSPELENKLESEAKRNGVSRDEFVRLVLEEKLNASPEIKSHKPPFESKIIATNLPVQDRSREYEWQAQNRDEYDGKYVALEGDKLIAVGNGFKEVAIKARESGFEKALVIFVEGSNRARFISGGLG